MKKTNVLIICLICIAMFIFPVISNAEVKITNFKETVSEEIQTFDGQSDYEKYISQLKKVDLSNYKESNNKINVYIFRGNKCSYCLKAITYFSSIVDSYGKYFNLVTYEVWNNEDNATLMNNVASFLGDKADGVPYIVIGNKTFIGYSETMNSEIENQIKKEYDSSDRYDVLIEMNNKKPESTSKDSLAITSIILEITLSIALFVYINIKYNKLYKKIDEIKKRK